MKPTKFPVYILDENDRVVREPDFLKWSAWMGTTDRRVAYDRIGKVSISTVFIGLDKDARSVDGPLVWETLVEGGGMEKVARCAGTREQAEAMHRDMMAFLRRWTADQL